LNAKLSAGYTVFGIYPEQVLTSFGYQNYGYLVILNVPHKDEDFQSLVLECQRVLKKL